MHVVAENLPFGITDSDICFTASRNPKSRLTTMVGLKPLPTILGTHAQLKRPETRINFCCKVCDMATW